MEEIVKKIIEEGEIFEIDNNYWEELKNDTLKELKRNPFADNQELWRGIKIMIEYIIDYIR